MKFSSYVLVFFLAVSGLSAQSYSFKNNTLYENGAAMFNLKNERSSDYKDHNDVIILNDKGEKLIFFKYEEYPDFSIGGGLQQYYDVMFSGSGQKTETRFYFLDAKLAKFIAGAHLIKDGKLDAEAIKTFTTAYPPKYSTRRKSLGR